MLPFSLNRANFAQTIHLSRIKTMAAADYIHNLVEEVLALQSKVGAQRIPHEHSKATAEAKLARIVEKLLLRRTMDLGGLPSGVHWSLQRWRW